MADRERLRGLLGTAELAWLMARLRQRIESGRALRGTVSLSRPTAAQRRAVDRLLGRSPSAGRSLTVDLEGLEARLSHAELCASLRQAVEILAGPLEDQKALIAQREQRWMRLYEESEADDPRPEVRAWLREQRTRQLVRRFSEKDPEAGRRLLGQALAVVSRLPQTGLPLAALAAETTGDSHALDANRPLGRLVLGAAARLAGRPLALGAADRREIWEAVGVVRDDLSASVLVLGLPAHGSSLTGQVLNLHAEAGEPCRLTTGQLLRHPPRFAPQPTGTTVYVCENPAVLGAAASGLGATSRPLLCVDGQPTIAVHLLLAKLAAGGLRLLYHGDFDWPGLRIASRLFDRYPMHPWRFGSEDYLVATGGLPLQGKPVPTPWDPQLRQALIDRGRSVHEEEVLGTLLEDLAGNR